MHEGVAEIDNVHTLERFRGRGVARAVVGRAVQEASSIAGADLVFLIADDADWPKELYAKLGFDPVEHVLAIHEAARRRVLSVAPDRQIPGRRASLALPGLES